MTSKPDSVSTLGYHWTDHTGRPLEPQVHWEATGTTLAEASTQWCPSSDPVLICIIGTHWKNTEKPLVGHWKHTGISPVACQCTLGSKFQAHWIATGLPLEDHSLRVRAGMIHGLYVPGAHLGRIIAYTEAEPKITWFSGIYQNTYTWPLPRALNTYAKPSTCYAGGVHGNELIIILGLPLYMRLMHTLFKYDIDIINMTISK